VPAAITNTFYLTCWKHAATLKDSIGHVAADAWEAGLEELAVTILADQTDSHLFHEKNPAREIAVALLLNDTGKLVTSDQKKLVELFDGFLGCMLVEFMYLQVVENFESKKATMPVQSLTVVFPFHILQTMATHINASSESGLKTKELKMKEYFDTVKDFTERIKATLGNTAKAIQKHNAELVKKEKTKDKDRATEEKKAQLAEKETAKAIRSLCKDTKSPGLLSYCGKVVCDVPHYSDLAALTEAKSQSTLDSLLPYIVVNAASLNQLVETRPLIKTSFGNFRAQVPHTPLAAQKKKVAENDWCNKRCVV
jgi:hypothetical protein